ncbi:MAG TPA: nuclear transport factor 2 family protein [Chryseolinea sp.]|nr:nuclear transport factor 2 family protein [Chryseolinea sp.]
MTNNEKAAAINRAVETADTETVATLVKENYIQHTPVVPDGKKGLLALISKIKNKEIPAPAIKNIRTFEDGEYVILHHDVHWSNRKVMFEIFRFEDGLAAEHWSGIADQPEPSVNNHSMIDGETAIKDRNKTVENKALVRDFLNHVLINSRFDQIQAYVHPQVIQHNPNLDNTISAWVRQLQQEGRHIEFQKVHYVFGEGNFVLSLSEGKFGTKHTAFFDLFRIEEGKIIEHWDVAQEVPEKMSHDNGMFKLPLYRRLGGYDSIAGFVDFAFPRVAAHPALTHFFIGHSHESKYRQRQLIVDKICSALQGPVVYIGRPLAMVHRGLNITHEQWNTFMEIIENAMDERGIIEEEKRDFIFTFENSFRSLTVEEELQE